MRLAQVSPFYFVDEVLAVYRVDTKDTGRLTNKYNEWLKAVDYIYTKHKNIIRNYLFGKILCKNDICTRCYWKNTKFWLKI